MAPRHAQKAARSSRPFIISTLLVTSLVSISLLVGPRWPARLSPSQPLSLESSVECHDIHHAADKCAFARAECGDDEAGLLSYIAFYYCTFGSVKPLAFVVLTGWLGLLFTTIGIAASDFFSVNLSTISRILGLSESLAGVTFLAFGNGSPDVFSTFAAMDSNSGSMAIGELIGAASFITAVIAGSMALVREFKVSKRTFVRDICFFIAAVSFTMLFLADGKLQPWECVVMIGFYLFYVVTVVSWHWLSTRRRRRRQKEAASRTHFHATTNQGADELEPYHDDPGEDDDAAPMTNTRRNGGSSSDLDDISALERSPRIEVYPADDDRLPPDDDEEERGIHVAAEMTSSMRVLRPQGRRRTTTITPIRPSLVGALEFRSVLSSLQRERNMHLAPIFTRTHSSDLLPTHAAYATQSSSNIPQSGGNPSSSFGAPIGRRDRALSSGDIPLGLQGETAAAFPLLGREGVSPNRRSVSSSISADGKLAPPGQGFSARTGGGGPPPNSFLPLLHTSGRGEGSSDNQAEGSVPFPEFSDSPVHVTPATPNQPPTTPFQLPSASIASRSSFPFQGTQEDLPKPIRWWPYRGLPPPHVLFGTLFPTLQGWREKSIWDKFVSTVSVPSIFLLVITLPVVDSGSQEEEDEEEDGNATETHVPGSPVHNNGQPTTDNGHSGVEQHEETEWQRYRRNRRRNSSRSPVHASPAMSPLALQPYTHALNDSSGEDIAAAILVAKPSSVDLAEGGPTSDPETWARESSSGWNRWLVALQLFTGPFFTVFIVWANMAEDLEEPRRTLLKLVLYSLLVSCVLLAILLLTTSPDKRPRYHFMLCFMGFIISVAWISTVAGEVVGVLKAIGVIFNISEAILGLTIFAVGNSLGDLVADVTVARLGYPVMALSACFGGPMLNILLGVGIGGLWMTAKSAKAKHAQNPDRPLHYESYHIHVSGTLMITAVTVLVTLVVLLVAVPLNRWVLSRRIGWGLIAIWSVSTFVNLVCEVAGVWSAVS